jgi:putative N-acetyltransferase (TIGR04045 family)
VAVSGSAPPRPASALSVLLARGAADLDAHFAVRRRIFVEQLAMFDGSDRDGHDDDAATLHAVGRVGDRIVGAVRLYPLGDRGLWKGDRLAVLPEDRVHRLGALLVRFAVAAAGERGGARMVAQIQLPNVRFFERLGWEHDGAPVTAYGVRHQPMAIALSRGP